MTLARVFTALNNEMSLLTNSLSGLCLTLREDRPAQGDSALADLFQDSVEDTQGWLGEVHPQVREVAQQLADSRVGVEGRQVDVWQALLFSQESLNKIELHLFDLSTPPRITFLLQLGQERTLEWEEWGDSVKDGLEQCVARLFEVKGAMLACWQEMGERFMYTALDLREHNIKI